MYDSVPVLVLEAQTTHWDSIAANSRGTSPPQVLKIGTGGVGYSRLFAEPQLNVKLLETVTDNCQNELIALFAPLVRSAQSAINSRNQYRSKKQ